MGSCKRCGRSVDEHDRDVRYRLPEPVLLLPEQDLTDGVWKSDDDPDAAVMMLVPDLGGFIRALVPVRLTGGYEVTFGVWVGVHPDDLGRAYDAWWTSGYSELRLEGRLANRLASWDVYAAPVQLAVLDTEAIPYCVSSTDPDLASVLGAEWDHEKVLAALPQ